ncbi:MAG TPA: TRIC cation channel family protein [Verrucomicrobiae bacterium]|nr:TRIC cation channel family protein [Verrucomicrobiae bacterium]
MNPQELHFSDAFNVSAVFFFALTGALAARRLGYDIIGVFALAFVTGLGGGLIRDSLLGGNGPVVALTDPLFMIAVLCATLCGLFRFSTKIERFNQIVAVLDAIGLGAFAVVGTDKALRMELHWLAAIFVGVVNAVGGGLLRDLLIRAEPLLLKPGQFYALAALTGAGAYAALTLHWKVPAFHAAFYATLATVLFRVLAIIFNWKTHAVEAPLESP